MYNLNSIDFDSIRSKVTPDLISKIQACETPEDLNAMTCSLGIALTDEQLTAVNGGDGIAPNVVPIPMPCSLNSPLLCSYAQPVKDIVNQIVKWLEKA